LATLASGNVCTAERNMPRSTVIVRFREVQ